MAEAATIGLVASIVTLVDLGTDVMGKANEMRKATSGMSAETQSLESTRERFISALKKFECARLD
ncbi:hypothetical protein BJY01DRAFT_210606 [Aspergillus pseudoustus]|uniref:Fungal N-terminal domain-containing protein n=1 Tax=Aspergillus pseudoustus TaxID=1810923 RepID=A0ABR4KCG2_9EURO